MLTFFSLGYQKFMPNPPTFQIDPNSTLFYSRILRKDDGIFANAKVSFVVLSKT